eukprot:3175726-Pleurochrysis_carterae.AAC.1
MTSHSCPNASHRTPPPVLSALKQRGLGAAPLKSDADRYHFIFCTSSAQLSDEKWWLVVRPPNTITVLPPAHEKDAVVSARSIALPGAGQGTSSSSACLSARHVQESLPKASVGSAAAMVASSSGCNESSMTHRRRKASGSADCSVGRDRRVCGASQGGEPRPV